MNRVRFLQKIALAAGVSLAMAFTFFACSDDSGNNSNSNGTGNYSIAGEERFFKIEGLPSKYNGYYVAANLMPKKNIQDLENINPGNIPSSVIGIMSKGCTGANSQEERVKDGKITLSMVDIESIFDENHNIPNEIVFQPCSAGEYMIQLLIVKNKEELVEGSAQTQMSASHFYTGGTLECVLYAHWGSGRLPEYNFKYEEMNEVKLSYSLFLQAADDASNPFASLACMNF